MVGGNGNDSGNEEVPSTPQILPRMSQGVIGGIGGGVGGAIPIDGTPMQMPMELDSNTPSSSLRSLSLSRRRLALNINNVRRPLIPQTPPEQNEHDTIRDLENDSLRGGNGGDLDGGESIALASQFGDASLLRGQQRQQQQQQAVNTETGTELPPPPPTTNAPFDEPDNDNAPRIRGTDIHVHTAARTFTDFLESFTSVEQSTKVLKRQERAERRRRRAAAAAAQGGSGGGGDSDDDSSISTVDSDMGMDIDNEEETSSNSTPLYKQVLKDILLGNPLSNAPDETTTNNTANANTAASLDLNTRHLYYHSPETQKLYHQLIAYPAEIVPLMDLVVGRLLESILEQLHQEQAEEEGDDEDMGFSTLPPLDGPVPRVQVRPYNLKSLSNMRGLDPSHMDSLLSIRGMVVRTSPLIPDLKVAHFSCAVCHHTIPITLDRGRIAEPTICPSCNARQSFELIHNRSLFADKQMVRLQETPHQVPAGETPASIVLFCFDDGVDNVRPGDRVEVTGVLRAQARRVNPKISKVKSVYKTYLDVIHFRKVSGEVTEEQQPGAESAEAAGKGIHVESIGTKFSTRRIAQLKALASQPDIYQQLVQSLAPSIWELDNVKKGVLCMLFGGNSKRVPAGTHKKNLVRGQRCQARKDALARGELLSDSEDEEEPEEMEGDEVVDPSKRKLNKRGDINILLCGDPGTSKSQLLGYVHKLSPRGVYTSGKGSSAVGLTASVVRDPETRDLVLESGALVLSDLGICCIDEFDKMSDTTRAILHEAMEQQTVSIAKAGIIATLNARTSILASANPVESRYNPKLSVVDNIKLPPTLLSRFDLIYLILDTPDEDADRRLAQHLVGLYYETPNVVQPPMDHALLRDYIAYARENIFPELSDRATTALITAYVNMRNSGSRGNGLRTITATPRQLESLIRLSEALAKMRYSTLVEKSDVDEAVRLMQVATQTAATDPRTGRIDMDMITTGRTSANREMEESLSLTIKELLSERRGNRMAVSDVRRQVSEVMNLSALRPDDIVETLRRLEADGLIQFNERNQTLFVRCGLIA